MRHELKNYKEGFEQVGDLRIFYRRFGQPVGEAPTLLLLHGGWATGDMNWSAHFQALAEKFHVVSPDHRGHGKTNNPSGTFSSYGRLAWDIIGLCDALSLKNIRVMGHSSGALISLHMSIFEPELIERQVLISIHPHIGKSESHAEGMRRFFGTNDAENPPDKLTYIWKFPIRAAALWWAHSDPDWYDLLRQAWPMWLKPIDLKAEDYKKVRCPTFLTIGTKDEFGKVTEAREFLGLIPNSTFQEIDGGKHMMVLDMAEKFRATVLPFLEKSGDPLL